MTRLQQVLATCLTVFTVVQLGNTQSCNPPCLNGGVCISENTCACTAEYEGPICSTPREPPQVSKPDCQK